MAWWLTLQHYNGKKSVFLEDPSEKADFCVISGAILSGTSLKKHCVHLGKAVE
ncbi:hypothetical protein FD28_GL000097 [Levilactobacillus hammesii DSM 16381]|uniref:Uncharacterized protein n=1 Tax=Levilactobacillus hammesii DSM 16381 TaxID=1423753 RepID=A0A0R1V3D9_9LACO|nr:hypothetical protein FD28_GL000097 [Levilactobacillus hammesii DSM 16381]